MKTIISTIFAALMLASLSAQAAQPIINLSIGGEISPGVYGQVQFGNAPPPPVFYPEPMVIVQPPPGRRLEPIYLHVPPGHAKNWARYCNRYNACNRPVYFVKSRSMSRATVNTKKKVAEMKDAGTRVAGIKAAGMNAVTKETGAATGITGTNIY